MLIIFDVDGTLIDGEETDWICFRNAYNTVTGKTFSMEFWQNLDEVTAPSIIQTAIAEFSSAEPSPLVSRVKDHTLEYLKEAHSNDRSAFSTTEKTLALLDYLQSHERLQLSIATGDWLETISFKLSAAGIDLSRYTNATASDTHRRADIIQLSAKRADRPLEDVIYVGDGIWDLRACRELGIPFIGTGQRIEALKKAGARWTLPELEIDPFLAIVEQIENAQ